VRPADADEDEDKAPDGGGRLTHGEPSGPAEFAGRAGAALVLGASGGLGSAIAAMLLTRGSRVAMTHRRPSPAVADLAARSPDSARGYQLDLTAAAADAVCFLASARARFISGQKLDVDGGYGA
jgi:NAD(P)-dependent dehydrogenase (short-subunit alcohol dehydrogenase family)